VIERRFGILLQLLAGTIVTVLLIIVVEVIAGFFVAKPTSALPPEIPGDTVSRTLTYLEVNPAPLTRDVDLLWRNEPGARKTQPMNPQKYGTQDTWTIENNSDGFRGPERSAANEKDDVYRILCIGDSITFGFNVDQNAAYPRQLQGLLEARYPQRRFEVINAGVPGWTWLQGLRFLATRGLALRPSLVVMGHGTNDQFLPAKVTDEERLHGLAGPVKKAVLSVGLLLARSNTYRLVERFFPPPPFSPERDSPGCEEQIKRTGACRRVSVDQIAQAVSEVHRLVTAAGADLLLANLDFARTGAIGGVRRTADLEHIPLIDAVDTLGSLRRADEIKRSDQLGLSPPSADPAAPSSAPARPKRVLLRVLTPDTSASYRVKGTAYFRTDFTFEERVHDDATHGDEKAGDGIYSTTIEVPANIGSIEYFFLRDDAPEFKPLPPLSSSVGDRLISVPQDTTGPVDVFGQSLLMAERAHPDKEGAGIVAKLVADRIEELPTFRRYVGSGS
jgi:lysophospholipase L1-like esterase